MNHQNFFTGLEDTFKTISKHVEIDVQNYHTYSGEIDSLYMSSASEFEVVSKDLCKVLDPQKEAKNIEDIYEVFHDKCPDILNEIISIRKYGLSIKPFENWTSDVRPDWWVHYNKVKHNRTGNSEKANLGNLINTLSALQIVNYYLVWKRDCPTKSRLAPPLKMSSHPDIFTMKDVNYSGPFLSDDVFDDVPRAAAESDTE